MKLGILGGGQLAQMLSLAAKSLEIETVCIDPSLDACSFDVTTLITANFTDEVALDKLLSQVDCVTFETENILLETAHGALKKKPFFPPVKALEMTQDRLHEKNFFRSLGIPVADFSAINSELDLHEAVEKIGLPAVLKTRRFGYDGKGQFVIKDKSQISTAWQQLKSASLILEQFIPFEYEVSLISVRGQNGEVAFYPLAKNYHEAGILRYSEAPFENKQLQAEAEKHAKKILNELQYVGVLAIEFFFDGKRLIANEMAPRVHNSGHWSIEGTKTSQFENHVRAVCGLTLGSTEAIGQSFMLNMIGETIEVDPSQSGIYSHAYGKAPRENRKVGHVTLVDADPVRYEKNKKILLAKLAL